MSGFYDVAVLTQVIMDDMKDGRLGSSLGVSQTGSSLRALSCKWFSGRINDFILEVDKVPLIELFHLFTNHLTL